MYINKSGVYMGEGSDMPYGGREATIEEINDFLFIKEAQANKQSILLQILELEAKQARPLREAFSHDEVVREQAMKYLKQYNDEITALRGQLL